jgi:hypothetical protein
MFRRPKISFIAEGRSMKTLVVILLVGWLTPAFAQVTNSWIKPTSGNWEDQTAWSLGSLPASDQTVAITNQGWKAVAIGASTTQSYSNSLNVGSVILGGYTDSFNLLLLNYAGFEVPLTAGSITVGTNSGIIALASAITVTTNSGPGDLSIFSTFIQSDNAAVNAHLINLGNFTNAAAGAGTYDETNGIVNADELSLANGSTLNQVDGADDFGTIWLGAADAGDTGVYNISDGYLTAGSIIAYRGSFNQAGGSVAASLGIGDATYTLSGGILNLPGITIPNVPYGARNPNFTGIGGGALLLQTGGTNLCNGNIQVYDEGASLINEPFEGAGSYVLSNGVLYVTGSVISWMSSFQQWGGWHTNAGTRVTGETLPSFYLRTGSFTLGGGILITPSISVSLGDFAQSGGTNYVSGEVDLGSDKSPATFELSGGVLADQTVVVDGTNPYTSGGQHAIFTQSGGTHIVTNALELLGWVSGNYQPNSVTSYVLSNGTISAPNIQIDGGAYFAHKGGTVTSSGVLTLGYGAWNEQTSNQQFGRLLINGAPGTNATFSFPASGGCFIHFTDSSSLAWSNQAVFSVRNWHGSTSGGGTTRIYFGSTSSGLTPQQLSQVVFTNPAGFASGGYTAKILSTGEIVPGQPTSPPSGLVNNWINPNSGKWEDSSSWSLGTPPASNQFVTITDHGFISVNIDGTTISSAPASMTVSNLLVAAPDQTYSTLLMNYFGLGTPLRVLNSCVVSNNSYLLNYGSSFEVDGTNDGALTIISGGSFQQEGGQTIVNGSVNIPGGYLSATNANLTLGQLTLGTPGTYGYVQHDGGSIASTFVNVVRGAYSLANGSLYAIQGLQLSSEAAAFYQSGGTNYGNITAGESSTYQLSGGMAQGNVLSAADSINHYTFEQDNGVLQMAFIDVTGGSNAALPSFELNNGTVWCGTLNIGGNGVFGQSGGQIFVTNNIDMHGDTFITSHGIISDTSNYRLNGGQLQAPSISMGQLSSFQQFGGSVSLPSGLNLTLPSASYKLSGGSLVTSYTGVTGDFQQTNGYHEVDGVLSLDGSYELSGGNLIVQGWYMRGALLLSGFGTFTNTGLVNLGGTVTTSISNAVLGQVQLATNANLAFTGNQARVLFSASAGISWTPGALLTISNWNGTVHVYFGSNASALTASQVNQITFSNPAGFAPGTYPAQILSTGEIVPGQRPTLASSRSGSALVLTWPANYRLLSATNLAGSWTPVSGATSPWTIHFTKPQEFFILQGM